MDLEQYAQESAAAIEAALLKYRFDKLALQDAEQTAAWTRETNGTGKVEDVPSLEPLRSSVEEQRRELIRLQNDRFRITFVGGQVMMTSGVQGRGESFVRACLSTVRTFDSFNEDNDPYGEHDFGALEIEGQKVYWKIDAYDRERCYGSEDPADPELTTRVLTLLLPEEY